MPIFGDYESTEELYRHGLGYVARARRISGGGESNTGEFAIKVLQPPIRVAGPEVLRAAVQSFQSLCRVQANLATESKYWAPIHASGSGPTPGAAYYVTDYCPRSLQKLIVGKVSLSPQALHHIVDSIVQGLLDLRKTAQRGHGDLRPTNVLLAGSGTIESTSVLLTDLAPAKQMTGSSDEALQSDETDLAALGSIIFELVLHRPFIGTQSDGSEWSRLGNHAERWRTLCNDLLQPVRSEPLTLDGVARGLEELKIRRSVWTAKRMVAASATLILLLISVSVFAYANYARNWRIFCDADEQWLYEFQRDLTSDKPRLTRLEQDPALHKIVDDVVALGDDLDPKRVAGNETMLVSELAHHPPMSLSALRKTDAATDLIHRIQETLTPKRWPILQKVDGARQRFEQRGWNDAAKSMADLVDGTRPGANMVDGMDRLLAQQSSLADDLDFIEDRWQPVAATITLIQARAADDRVLGQFVGFANRYAAAVPVSNDQPMTEILGNLRDALLPLKKLATDLLTVLQSDWLTRIDRTRLASEAEVYKNSGNAGASVFHDWLQQIQDYYYVDRSGEITAAVTDVNAAATKTDGAITAIPNNFPEYPAIVGDLKKRFADAKQRIATELTNQTWVTKDRQNELIATRRDAIEKEFRDVAADAQHVQSRYTVDQKQWWDQFVTTPPAEDSAAIASVWERWRTYLPIQDRTRFPIDGAAFDALRSQTQQWRDALVAADKKFAPPPALEEPYGSMARNKREQEIAAVIRAAGPGNPPDLTAFDSQLRSRGDSYATWCESVGPIVQEFEHASDQLDAAYGLNDDPASAVTKLNSLKDQPAWPDVAKQQLPVNVLHRIAALSQVDQMSRGDLVRIASASETTPDLALATWRRNAALRDSRWPSTEAELSAEASIEKNISTLAGRIKDPFRVQQVRAELHDGSIAMLLRFASVPRKPAERVPAFTAAVNGAASLGVVTAPSNNPWLQCNQLTTALAAPPATHFDLMVAALQAQAEQSPGTPREAVLKSADDFRDEVGKLPADFRQQPSVTKLLTQLESLKEVEPPRGPQAPWKTESPSGGIQTFTLNLNSATVSLQFARVQPKGADATYLCTTELSFAEFAALTASQPAPAVRQLLVDFAPDADPRLGPRVWDWQDPASGSKTVLKQPDSWLRPRQDDSDQWDYPVGFRDHLSQFNRSSLDASVGGNPLGRSHLPMNYLPAPTAMYLAGLIGCRLPTSSEWAAANALTQHTGHLRGATWRKQLQYVVQTGGQLQWPDAGIFWPKGDAATRKAGASADAANIADSTLYFMETAAGGEPLFHHLTGNIAEFVFDAPLVVDQLPDKSFAGVKAFLEKTSNQLFVIGGSALSAPELPVDAPLAVDLQSKSFPNAWTGFADVGMRLAYSASVPPAERLDAILAGTPSTIH